MKRKGNVVARCITSTFFKKKIINEVIVCMDSKNITQGDMELALEMGISKYNGGGSRGCSGDESDECCVCVLPAFGFSIFVNSLPKKIQAKSD